MAYQTVLLDLDHTLLDSETSEIMAFHNALSASGVAQPESHFASYVAINRALWAAVERREITPDGVRVTRFERLAAEAGLDVDPERLADAYVAGLGSHGELYPGARKMLETVSATAQLALVTNGLGDVQRARIERLDIARYFAAVVISAEVGTAKPAPEIFELAFAALGAPDPDSAVMVGDSLTSDVAGAQAFGISACWYNPQRRAGPTEWPPDYEIATLEDIVGIVAGPS